MGGDLEHAIGRRITDRLAGLEMLFAELRDNVGAGGVTITEDARQGGLFHKCVDEFFRKARFGLREIAPVKPNRHASDFPMTGGCVFSPGLLAGAATLRADLAAIRQSR